MTNTVVLNGTDTPLTDGLTVAHAVTQLTGRELTDSGTPADGAPLGIAVALDDAVVPRSRWATTALRPGQRVEVVTAVQGG